MSFGKRNIDKRPPGPAPFEVQTSAIAPSRDLPIRIPRLMVFVVGMTVALAAISALSMDVFNSSRSEMVQVEAAWIDGTPATLSTRAQLVGLCVEQSMLTATALDGIDNDKRAKAAKGCECAFGELADQLTPLQVHMLTHDQRARLRASMAELDRTGERIAVGTLPRLEPRESAAMAVVSAERYQQYWREARDAASRQSMRCKS